MKKNFHTKHVLWTMLLLILVLAAVMLAGCKKDDQDDPGSCAHTDTTERVVKEPTCTEAGSKIVICNACQHEGAVVEIPALGHDYKADAANSVVATCTTSGKTAYQCSRCTAAYTEVVAQLVHEFVVDEANSVEPTCTTAGKRVQKCKTCTETTEQILTATGHNYLNAEGLVAADCEERTCSNPGCGETLAAKVAHQWNLVYSTATCVEAGTDTFECALCHGEREADASATGHDLLTAWREVGEPVPATSATYDLGDECLYVVTRQATCKDCGVVEEEDTKVIHAYEFGVITESTDCQHPGVKGIRCSRCGDNPKPEENVTYTVDHAWNNGEEAATYTKYTCNTPDCGEVRYEYAETAEVSKETLGANEVKVNGIVVSMKDADLSGVTESNATLTANKHSKDDVLASLGEIAGLDRVGAEDEIYDLTLMNGTSAVTDFSGDGTGKVTVTIPYTLGEGEDPASIIIFYLGPDGIEEITNGVYHDGYLTFTTDHFSYYTVGRYTPAQICARYGHTMRVLEAAPDCTQAGFNLTYCTRCGAVTDDYNPYIPALGHHDADAETVDADCTTDGYRNFVCDREGCGFSYTEVIESTGHTWAIDENTPATCTTAGKLKQTCSECGAVYTETIAQKAHELSKVVTKPTCTTAGYSTYSCKDCSLSYKSDYVAAKGHTWNVAAPTCGVGQVCTVCNEAGSPATGAHNMVNGECTVCGYGCAHQWQMTSEQAATCEVGGFKLYTCSVCNKQETRDFTKPIGHTFTGSFTPCTTCNGANPGLAEAMKTMLASMASESYSIRLTDLEFEVKTHYVEENKDVYEVRAKIDASSIDLVIDGDKIKFYLDIDAIFSESSGATPVWEEGAIDIYCDGEYVYYISDGEYSRYSLTEALENGVEVGGTPVTPGNAEEVLAQMLTGLLGPDLLGQWQTIVNSKTDLFFEGIGQLMMVFFTEEKTATGTTLTFDKSAIKNFNDALYNKTLSELVDAYGGAGSYNKLQDFVVQTGNMTLSELATALLSFAEQNGIDDALIFSTVNTVMTNMSGEPFDLAAMLESEEMTSMKVWVLVQSMMGGSDSDGEMNDQLAPAPMSTTEEFDFAAAVAEAFEQYATLKLYDMIPDGAEVYEMLNKMLSADDSSLVIKLNAEGKITEIVYNMTDMEAGGVVVGGTDSVRPGNGDGSVTIYPEEPETEQNVTMSGTLVIKPSGSLPAEAGDVAAEFEAIYASVQEAIRAALRAETEQKLMLIDREYGWTALMLSMTPSGVVRVSFYELGNLSVEMASDEDLFANAEVTLRENCANTYAITLSCESDYGRYFNARMYRYFNARIYVDVAAGKITVEDAHDWIEMDESMIPAGAPTSREDVTCGEYWYTYYICTNCGEQKRDSNYKSHDQKTTYTLSEGSTTCEDGIDAVTTCESCGEWLYTTLNRKPDYRNDHWDLNSTYYTIDTPHGAMKVCVRSCACGFSTDFISCVDDTSGCIVNAYDSSAAAPILNAAGEQIGWKYVYNCALTHTTPGGEATPCSFYMERLQYHSEPTDKPCHYRNTTVYNFYNGATLVKSFTLNDTNISHGWNEDDEFETVTEWPNGQIYERTYGHTCAEDGCDYYVEECSRYDELGRETYHSYKEYYNGRYLENYEERWEYLNPTGCLATCYYFDHMYGDEWYEQGTTYNHNYSYGTLVQAATCTQPSIYFDGCMIEGCGQGSYYSYGANGHYWEYDYELETYVCWSCGLESVAGNSAISMEDLSKHNFYGAKGDIVVGFCADSENLQTMFYFVNKNDTEDQKYVGVNFELVRGIEDYYERDESLLVISYADLMSAMAEAGVTLDEYDFAITLSIAGGDANDPTTYSTLVLTDIVLPQ